MIKIPSFLNDLITKAKLLVMAEVNPELTGNESTAENSRDESLAESSAVESSDVVHDVSRAKSSDGKKVSLLNGISAVFNGLGIGLLLGLLLGLSISPVVSGVIATLSSLLAVLIGLNEKYLDPLKSLRIGAFGLFAVAGILIGLYLRANDTFAPSLLERKNEYVAMGYSDAEARAFITKAVEADTGKTRRQANVLYSSSVDVGACDVLVYASASQSSAEIANTFQEAGGTWKELADSFQNDLDEDIVGISLLAIRDCFCGLTSSGEIKMTGLDKVRVLGISDSVSHIEDVLSASGESWQAIVDEVRKNIPEDKRKDVYLSVIKVLSHD